MAERMRRHTPVSVLDLATGTGSNFRFLAPLLPSPQQWLLVDRRPDLLQLVRERTSAWATERGFTVDDAGEGFRVHGADLDATVVTLVRNLDLPLGADIFEGRHLVTASALLDLVSTSWLDALATRCSEADAAVLFALTYDGQSAFEPRDEEDDLARDLLNEHQHRDKGLGGPAAGPDAPAAAARAFTGVGYEVYEGASDWRIGPDQSAFQAQLIDGLAQAGREQRPDLAATLDAWQSRRHAHLEAGRSHARVGHRDLMAWRR
ncbi:MAG: class I SAM-dependent methyltransferase [Acidobacteria bacterium]|nr:class I SAM-dependent methyltransferase [Acidobacteriota bacterium]